MDYKTDNFDEICSILNEGKVILYPTDTIWGLGCDALNPVAIKKIYKIKKRIPAKPFIVLVSDIEMLKSYVREIHPRVETLLAYHTRPLTVIYRAKKNVPDILLEKGNVAIRVVQEKTIADFIRYFGKPIVSTSANISDEPFPKIFVEISDQVKAAVDYIFFHKRDMTEPGQPSTIAAHSKSGKLRFLR